MNLLLLLLFFVLPMTLATFAIARLFGSMGVGDALSWGLFDAEGSRRTRRDE